MPLPYVLPAEFGRSTSESKHKKKEPLKFGYAEASTFLEGGKADPIKYRSHVTSIIRGAPKVVVR